MIKKLQRNFIAIAMALIGLIMIVVLIAVNSINWVSTNATANETLEVLVENISQPEEDYSNDENTNPFKTLEVAIHSQFFYVRFYTDSDEVVIRSSVTSEIDVGQEESVLEYAKYVYEAGKEDGTIEMYKYDSLPTGDGVIYVFLDCHEAFSAFYNFLGYSILIAVVGLAVVFVVLFFLSKLAVRPYVQNYESQRQFTADASHELKTPLAIILANTELLECDVGEREEIDAIKNSVNRANGMISNLLYLSKLEDGAIQISPVDFDLSIETEEMIDSFIPLAFSNGKEIETDIDPNIMVHGDVKSLKELVSILLDNAVKYTKESGTIKVSLKPDVKNNKKVILQVSNPTVDVSQGEHQEFFTRF